MDRTSVWKLVQTRARSIGLKKRVCSHSFRATGITEYMSAGGSLEIAQRIAGHAQLSTTKIYDRSEDRLTILEISLDFGLHSVSDPVRSVPLQFTSCYRYRDPASSVWVENASQRSNQTNVLKFSGW